MNKVLQAAGRLIRTSEDYGVIALLDERFCRDRIEVSFRQIDRYEHCTTFKLYSAVRTVLGRY